jgi:hypothetical protein
MVLDRLGYICVYGPAPAPQKKAIDRTFLLYAGLSQITD